MLTLIREREREMMRVDMVSASFTAWQIGLILSSLLGGKKTKWMGFNEWLNNLGLGTQVSDKPSSAVVAQNTIIESARIKSKIEPISQKLLLQRNKVKQTDSTV